MHTDRNRDIADNEQAWTTLAFNDALTQLASSKSDGKPYGLPSWTETASLLEDLHTLYMTFMDYEETRETLARVVRGLLSQVEICGGTGDVPKPIDGFLAELPKIRQALTEDVQAALRCDPAATSANEVVLCYPGMRALAIYRTAHALHRLDVPLLPRLMTEIAHSVTGIDIHPAAEIGKRFFIDHGTGIVIGATCVIGDDVKIYQGVTLGARSFPRSTDGHIIRDRQRHPVIHDNVTIFAGATILGPVNIGSNSVIGGNVWITSDVAANSKLRQRRPRQAADHGSG